MDRFWEKVAVGEQDECWQWTAAVNGRGYGSFKEGGCSLSAHRVAFRLHTKQEAEGVVCHTCDNKLCCNPAHLYDGTKASNAQDAVERGQHPRGGRHGRAKLSPKGVLQMRKRHAEGESFAAIGREFGVSDTVARKAVLGVTWGHL